MSGNVMGMTPPEFPEEAGQFIFELAELTKKYGIEEATVDIRVDTGPFSRFKNKTNHAKVQETMKFHVSNRDGRGRPRRKVTVYATINMQQALIDEPDSTS